MKAKFFLCMILALGTFCSPAQSPLALNYQSVLHDGNGGVLSNITISVRFTINDSLNPGIPVYRETQSVTTNSIGLFTAQIGFGNSDPGLGPFTSIKWNNGPKYLQIAMDPSGGNTFINMGSSQLLSVPYALYATNSDTAAYALNNIAARAITVDTVFTGLDDISTDVSTTPTQLQTGVQTFTKQYPTSSVELYLFSRMPSGTFTGGATSIGFWLQIDGNPARYTTQQFLTQSGIIQYISLDAAFPGLPAGPHTVSIWGQTDAGTSTGIYVDQGGWGGSIMVKEVN